MPLGDTSTQMTVTVMPGRGYQFQNLNTEVTVLELGSSP